ncbi:hypothetical protein [Salinibacter altiplanensis]|uniref:hypothetical protein n=1 Tax=Salinibacter altiplanensis TaxID=1803181 RepID=UPI00131A55A7|nr:hypothetical protein [Salinibacter altiplanensis]
MDADEINKALNRGGEEPDTSITLYPNVNPEEVREELDEAARRGDFGDDEG